MGRYGKFLACPGFPECRNTKPLLEKVDDVQCPRCEGDVLIKKNKKGRRYYGCETILNVSLCHGINLPLRNVSYVGA